MALGTVHIAMGAQTPSARAAQAASVEATESRLAIAVAFWMRFMRSTHQLRR